MIDLYTCKTANGYRASIMLEECGLPYVVHAVDLAAGVQRTPAFLGMNALGRVPVIVDDDAVVDGKSGGRLAVSESLAIAVYVAEKADRLIPKAPAERAMAWQWSATVVSGFSAAAAGIFFSRELGAEPHAKIIAKFFADIDLYLSAMDQRLAASRYLAGDAPSFADMLAIPTIVRSLPAMNVDCSAYQSIGRWSGEIGARDAVIRGLAVPG